MEKLYILLFSGFSVLFSSQTILNQSETTARIVQDPNVVLLAPGFHAASSVSNPFVARIGNSETPPTLVDSEAGSGNPSGTTETESNRFHDTQGNIEVNGGGQLQFTLPIALPPGVKSVAPQVNLVYTSGSGNGIAGYGWNLSGITSISRVGRNIEKDGEVRGVQLDYSDYYSFNGQRLILKSGEYGKDDAEYVTEKFSNIKIKSVGAVSGVTWKGPEYWEVTFEDGSQAWYGASTTGASDARTPAEYNIVKWRDAQGNYISYEYNQDTGTNVAVISSIRWGGNESLNKAHFNEISFNYRIRNLLENSYVRGQQFLQKKSLLNIAVFANNTFFRQYNIEYGIDLSISKYEYVKSIKELNSKGESANPTEFFNPEIPSTVAKRRDLSANLISENKKYGDFDGDGRIDLLYYDAGTGGHYECLEFDEYGRCEREGNYIEPTEGGTYIVLNRFDGYFSPLKVSSEDLSNGIVMGGLINASGQVSPSQGIVTKQLPTLSSPTISLKSYILENNVFVPIKTTEIPASQFDNSYIEPLNPKTFEPHVESSTSLGSFKDIDINGDGVSELIFTAKDNVCVYDTFTTDNFASYKTFKKDSKKTKDNYGTLGAPIGWEVRCQDNYRNFIIELNNPLVSNFLKEINLSKDVSEYDIFDTDGDGRSDIIEKTDNALTIISEFKINYGKYQAEKYIHTNYNGEKQGLGYGDFNGDGKVDFIVPEKTTGTTTTWKIYTNTGLSFSETVYTNLFPYRKDEEISNSGRKRKILKYNFNKDVNGDGKDDLIFVESQTFDKHDIGTNRDSSFELKIKINEGVGALQNVNFRDSYRDYIDSTTPDHFIPINISSRIHGIDRFIMVKHGNYSFFAYDFLNVPFQYTINQIKQGGITTNITYNAIDAGNTNTSTFYQNTQEAKQLLYPLTVFSNLPSKSLVVQLIQDNRKQDFKYRDLIVHLQGKGMIGFRQTARSTWYSEGFENTIIWSGVEIDPLNDGVPVKEWSIKTNSEAQIFPTDLSESNIQLLSFKSTQYRFDKLLNGNIVDFNNISAADKSKVVSATIPVKSITKDFMKDVRTESIVKYDKEDVQQVTERYYLPTKTTADINSGFAVSTTDLSYLHNASGTGKDYYIGRPASKTEQMTVYGDTKGAKEEYAYEGNLLKTKKSWNRDNSGWFMEAYTYDSFGNITEKTLTSSHNLNHSKTDKAAYEAQGRFVIKKTDNLGLETHITYNNWGQVLTQSDPIGNVLTNTYDSWGKLLTSKTNLGGTTTYEYKKESSGDAVVTEYAPDGTEKLSYTNRLGQNYINKTRKFGYGQFVSVLTSFDVLGRKTAESEPYSGSPTRWNTIEYDEYSRPVKATSFTGKIVESTYSGRTVTTTETNANNRFKKQTADALGNIISAEDLGGVIYFKFNAAGENIEANYEGNIVKTSYDAWGNKVRFEDPSNGVYEYQYNGFMGAISKINSPKGEKTYEYNSLGQLTTQKEKSTAGNTTDKTINFSYNSKGMITGKSGTSLGKAYSSGITYDSYGRVMSSYEDSNGKYFMKKGITYDDKMRVTSYEKQLYSSGILTKVTVENEYDAWSGALYRVKEKGSGKILWQLDEVNDKGQVTQAKLGNVNINNTYAANGFLNNVNHTNTSGNTILQVGYSFNAIKNELNSRTTGGDFNIIEQFEYDGNNRLINWTDPVTGAFTQNQQRNVYDNKGRITQNDQVGTIKFDNAAKKYQATGMVLNADGTQNYTNDLVQSITYNANNDPFRIDGLRGDVAFEYGLTSMRQRVTYGGNFGEGQDGKFTKYYSEDGSFEVIRNNQTGEEKHLIYIGGSPYESDIVFVKGYTESSGSFKFLHKDYLGSVLAITDEAGTKIEQRHFDAWGNLTHLKIGNNATVTDKEQIRTYLADGNLIVDRGYTSHEHFAEVGLIHMNGRLYDPLLRRFLNADENIQDPHNTQNYNKYGYVMNNPLMYSDPSGELFFLIPLVGYFWSAVIMGAAIGAASYMISAAITGQQITLGGFLKSTFFGAVGGAATFGIGSIFSNTAGTITTLAQSIKDTVGGVGLAIVQAGTHAVSQGVLGLMQGQSFVSGAAAGFLGSLGAAGWGAAVGNKFAGSTVGQITFGALSGGIGAELTGGNFWQGALAGGMVAGLNHAMHSIDSPFADDGDGDGPGPKPKRKATVTKKISRESKGRNLIGDEVTYYSSNSLSTPGDPNVEYTYENGSKTPEISYKKNYLGLEFNVSIDGGSISGLSVGINTPWFSSNGGISKGAFFQEFSHKSNNHTGTLGVRYRPLPKTMPRLAPLPMPSGRRIFFVP